jgi:hypothetical protein
VEDIVEGSGESQRHLRRMVFVSNRGLVQSEAILVAPSKALSPGQEKPQNGSGKNARDVGKKNGPKEKPVVAKEEQQPLVVDPSQLAFEYHSAIIAGMALVVGR